MIMKDKSEGYVRDHGPFQDMNPASREETKENNKNLLRITNVPVEIRNNYLLNADQEL
jgi:hypothetical protein